jgi:hypothetical protein
MRATTFAEGLTEEQKEQLYNELERDYYEQIEYRDIVLSVWDNHSCREI